MVETEPRQIQSIKTAFAVLEHIRQNGGSGVTDVANALSVSKSTAHAHLTTMVSLGYIVKTDDEYHLSLQFLRLGDQARSRYNLYKTAKSEMDQFAQSTGERCQLMVVEGHRGIYIYQTAGEKAVQTDSHIGSTVNLHNTAVGKSYLAYLPSEDVEAYLQAVGLPEQTENTITDRDTLFEELETVREQKYALNLEERIMGMQAVGAPILTEETEVLGAISVSVPTIRITDTIRNSDFPQQIQRVARVIALRTTYN